MGNLLCQLLWLFVSFSRDPLSLIPVVRWHQSTDKLDPAWARVWCTPYRPILRILSQASTLDRVQPEEKNGRSKPSNDRSHVATLRRPTLCHGWRQWESLQKSCRCLLLRKWCISLHQPFSHRLSDLSPLQCPGMPRHAQACPGMPRHSTKNVKKHVCSTYTSIHGCLWKCFVPHCTQWFCWSLSPIFNGYFIGNINPTFSDKPTWIHRSIDP